MPIDNSESVDARHRLAYNELNDAAAATKIATEKVFSEAARDGITDRNGDRIFQNTSFSVDQIQGTNDEQMSDLVGRLYELKASTLEQQPQNEILENIDTLINAIDELNSADELYEVGAAHNGGVYGGSGNGFPAERVQQIQTHADQAQSLAESLSRDLN
jgi:hypothetical protein